MQLLSGTAATVNPANLTHHYSIRWSRLYFNLFGPLMVIPNWFDREAYRRFIEGGRFNEARAVIDLGAGTGYLARRLLREALPDTATLTLLEASDTQLALLKARFGERHPRVSLRQVTTPPPFPDQAGAYDRFVACFVLETMDRSTQETYLAEAHRLLEDGGLLCLMSVTGGTTPLARLVLRIAAILARFSPWLVFGARIGGLEPLLRGPEWEIRRRETVESSGCANELIIARKVPS